MSTPADTAWQRLEELGTISDSPEHLVRTFLSPANLAAARTVIGWMDGIGMHCDHAADGTVRGILDGADPEAPPLLLGSHLDTVINAGKYDGALGIVTAIAALETLRREEITLPFPVHVLGFSDEEGVRFHATYLGSRGIAGTLDGTAMEITDVSGKSLCHAIDSEGWHEGASTILYQPGKVRGYVEVHIEQGRVLEEAGEALCAVSAIAGQTRVMARMSGRADHAGTTPMPLRRDALAGAAECIVAIESIARSSDPLVATVGRIEVLPGASNSVPSSAAFTIDIRHPEDAARVSAVAEIQNTCAAVASHRGLVFEWNIVQETDAVPCDPVLTESLCKATGNPRLLASGAGHDGVAVSAIAPIAMIFVRCRGGLSHHPDEFASQEDVAASVDALVRFLKTLATSDHA
ncbi:MAG: M20 family metallo-hydrolase [Akkermansiaceae bacterium]|nr:M20 family metallo-hydrolase [Akkermansiaceae bacterium]